MTSKLLTNPKYWRDRAEEIEAIADRLANQETKRTMQDIVIGYEQVARRAEERLSASGKVVDPGLALEGTCHDRLSNNEMVS
jgi:hypothetical protein